MTEQPTPRLADIRGALGHARTAVTRQYTAPAQLDPDAVSAVLRDDSSPLYPSRISVYCDECGATATGEYMVSTDQTRTERLAVARAHLSAKGWRIDDDGDCCTACAHPATAAVLAEVAAERIRQNERWGEQNHPDGTGITPEQQKLADVARAMCQQVFAEGRGDWAHVLMEEVREALAESDPARLRAELVQVAAVAVCWIESGDRRTPDLS